jgi:hypothetical protein
MIEVNFSNPIRRYGLARSDTSLTSARNTPISARLSAYLSGTTMPLPNVVSGRTAQCTARSKRSLRRCMNPCAYGMPVCKFHGARRRESILRGSDHPKFIHGREIQQHRQARREASIRLRQLENLMHLFGFTTARRTPGRKPGSKLRN